MMTIESDYNQAISNDSESLSQANHGISNEGLGTQRKDATGTKKMKEYIIIVIIIALLQIKKTITFPAETSEERKKHKKNIKWYTMKIIIGLLLIATLAIGNSHKTSIYSHPAPVYNEEKLIYQPFTQEYGHNNKKTRIENQIQEHEQRILEITQKTDKRQIYSHLPLLANFISYRNKRIQV